MSGSERREKVPESWASSAWYVAGGWGSSSQEISQTTLFPSSLQMQDRGLSSGWATSPLASHLLMPQTTASVCGRDQKYLQLQIQNINIHMFHFLVILFYLFLFCRLSLGATGLLSKGFQHLALLVKEMSASSENNCFPKGCRGSGSLLPDISVCLSYF